MIESWLFKAPSLQMKHTHQMSTTSLQGAEGGKSPGQPQKLLSSQSLGMQICIERERTDCPSPASKQTQQGKAAIPALYWHFSSCRSSAYRVENAPSLHSLWGTLFSTGVSKTLGWLGCSADDCYKCSILWFTGISLEIHVNKDPLLCTENRPCSSAVSARSSLSFAQKSFGQLFSTRAEEGDQGRYLSSEHFFPRLGIAAQGTAGFLSSFPLLNCRKCPN